MSVLEGPTRWREEITPIDFQCDQGIRQIIYSRDEVDYDPFGLQVAEAFFHPLSNLTVCKTRKQLAEALQNASDPETTLVILDHHITGLGVPDLNLLYPVLKTLTDTQVQTALAIWTVCRDHEIGSMVRNSDLLEDCVADHHFSKDGSNLMERIVDRGLPKLTPQQTLVRPI